MGADLARTHPTHTEDEFVTVAGAQNHAEVEFLDGTLLNGLARISTSALTGAFL